MDQKDLIKVAQKLPLSKSTLALNAGGAAQADEASHAGPGLATRKGMFKGLAATRRIRQRHKPLMNKLERTWFDWLKQKYPDARIFPQAMRFMLANGLWYKPDFVVWTNRGLEKVPTSWGWNIQGKPIVETAYEVKGLKAWRGGFENLKMAASIYQDITWILVWKDKYGFWREQEVLP